MEDKRLDRIEKKIDDLSEHLSSIDITLASQHISLKEHMRRTSILEKELAPVKRRLNMSDGILKFLGVLAAIATIVEAFRLITK